MITQSQNLSLKLYFDDYQSDYRVQSLWDQLKETAVEVIEAPILDFSIFAGECLFCAIVMKKNPNQTQFSDEQIMARNVVNEFLDPSEGPHDDEPIGLVYITAAPAQSMTGEANVGIIITDSCRCKGFACEAVELVLRWAFEELNFHRIQAAIMDTAMRDRAMRLFIGQGFKHEGTRRRSLYKRESAGLAGAWKDVTYLAMLDTEWALRDVLRIRGPAPTMWDEMFSRHAREREDMVKWDEKHGRVRRALSTETLRNGETPNPLSPNNIIDTWLPSDLESSRPSSRQSSYCGSVPSSPAAGAADISQSMLEYLTFVENVKSEMEEEDAISRQSSPSPYSFSSSTTIPVPPRSPSVTSSVSFAFESEDEGDASPSWRGLHGVPTSSASTASSSQFSLARHPLLTVRSRSVSGSSESDAWSNAERPDGSDWDMMSEPESVASSV